jgi:hypothetical protein
MKVKIKRLNNEVYQFDDVIDIQIESIEVINTSKPQSRENTKQIYVCNELGNLVVNIVRETKKAFLVNAGEKEVWLPKSKVVGNRINEKDFNYFVNKK